MTLPAIVVVGDLMTDVTVRAEVGAVASGSDTPAEIVIGGGGAGGNVAAALGRLRPPAGLITRVGDDGAGRAVLGDLERAGVTVHGQIDPTVATGTVVAIVDADGERSMLTDRGANRYLAHDDLPDDWFRAGAHLHLSGYTLFEQPARATAIEVLRRAEVVGMTISVDPASWAPLQAFGPARFLQLTGTAQLCLPNAAEARVLTGLAEPAAAARRLAEHFGTAVVTCGADGAVWSDGHRERRQRADRIDVIDTTGAGDAFAARYLAAVLDGAAPREALTLAVRSATAAAAGPGARH